ncbi:MAG: DUF294 nucleotidyltransferase-like domain-containing protein [Bacillus sp. (in: firmicutes)]
MEEQKRDMLTAVRFHPFFQGADPVDISPLLEMCEEREYKAGDGILYASQQRRGLFLVIEGIAEVYVKDEKYNRVEVLEIIRKGEMIGFSSLADFLGAAEQEEAKAEELVEVRAVETVYALYIPFEAVMKRWTDPVVHDYFLTQVAIRLRDVYRSLAEQVKLSRGFGESEALVLRVQDMMSHSIISCTPETEAGEAAAIMSRNRISSVVVMEQRELKGIVTERDIVERIVAAGRPYHSPVSAIMTASPLMISRFSYYYEALSMMVLHGVKRLPVEDQGRICGMLTLSDLLRRKNESMMKTIHRIEEADSGSLPQVKDAIYDVFEILLKEQVPMMNVLAIATKLFDRLIKRAVDMAIHDVEANHGHKAPVAFNLYMMGSAGRGEQFILTDQDHFLVFENSDDPKVHSYFRLLGEKIVHYLELAGYARCKGLMMSSEAVWRGTLVDWRLRLREWSVRSTNEQLLLAINFFSYRLVYGNQELHAAFEEVIDETLQRHHLFLFRLAQMEQERPIALLGRPIRSLFRLEKKSIDVKKEILFPYHHGLQILSMVHGVLSGTPFERVEALKQKGVISKSFAHDIREAANQVLALYVRLRYQQAKQGMESSSVLYFNSLTTREKEELILSVKTLKELQNKLFYRFSIQI